MKAVAWLVGGAVALVGGLVFAAERRKGGTFTIMLGSQVRLPNDDATLNALETGFGWRLEDVATRYLTTTANGIQFGVTFRSDAHTPAMPAKGKAITLPSGAPVKVVSVTQAPVK